MGWLDDFVKNPVGTVSNTVNSAVSDASNGINAAVTDFGRSDVGKFVNDSAQATVNIAKAPFEVAYYGFRGDNAGVSRSIQRAVGSGVNLQGSQSGNLFNNQTLGIRAAQTDVGQYVLRNQAVSNATFGVSEDYAGLYRGSRTLQDNAYLSRQDQNSILKLGVKAAAFAGAATAYQNWWGGLDKAGQLKYGKYVNNPLVNYGAGQSAYKGDYGGAAKKLVGNNVPDFTEYLPQLPNLPPEFSEIPKYLDLNPKSPSSASSSPYGSSGVTVKDPWSFSGVSDSGIVNAAQSSILPIALGVGVLAFIYFRGLK